MLQIISGKFYKSPERYSTPCKGITFSNYHTVAPIETCVATLEPVETYSSATGAYVINYTNVIEKPQQVQGISVVRGGDSVVVRQFELLCIFGLNAFFDGDRQSVEMNCRAKPSQATDVNVPGHYVERVFDPSIHATPDDTAGFVKFVEQVIGLPRKQYVAVISALETLAHSLEAINYQLDLAYSMLVYSLESLCQSFGEYTPVWDDYEDNVRDKLDTLFAEVDPAVASSIKDVLLEASHLRLRRRFLSFATNYIKPSFYVEEAKGRTRPVKMSELERCLSNSYIMRSGFVHQLSPILSQLRIPQTAKGDVFVWDNEPYLTYQGLLRVVRHVIYSFIDAQPSLATEDFNWRTALPGVVEFKMAPEYWVWHPESFEANQSRQRLSGTLSLLQKTYSDNQPVQLNPLPLLEKVESLLGQANAIDRSAMLATHSIILHQFVPKEQWPASSAKIVSDNQSAFNVCCIEMMLVWMITEDTWPWSADESGKALEAYRRSKFKKNAIAVPTLLEMCLCAQVANQFLAEQKTVEYEQWCDNAFFDAPGISVLQEYIEATKAEGTELDSQQIITLCREVGTAENEAEAEQNDTDAKSGDSSEQASQTPSNTSHETAVSEEQTAEVLEGKDSESSAVADEESSEPEVVSEGEKCDSPTKSDAAQAKEPNLEQKPSESQGTEDDTGT